MAVVKQKPELEVRMSATLGDGDMNFRKVEVSLMMPCEVDDIDETYNAVKEFVKGNLEETVAEITASTGMGKVKEAEPDVNLDEQL